MSTYYQTVMRNSIPFSDSCKGSNAAHFLDMEIQDIRRTRLAQLISEKYGSQANFVDQTNENQGEISAILRGKSFGEKKARKLEQKCGLPMYWLDGDMAPVTASSQACEVAKAFDSLTPKQQEAVMTMIESYGPSIPRSPTLSVEAPSSLRQSEQGVTISTSQSGGQKQSFGSSSLE